MVFKKNINKVVALSMIALPLIAGCGPKENTGSASTSPGAKGGGAPVAAPTGAVGNAAAQTKAQNESIEKLKQYQAQQKK